MSALAITIGLCCSAAPADTFSITVDSAIADKPISGRVLLMLSRSQRFRPGENGTPIFGVTVDDLEPGGTAVVDADALGHPVRSLADIPAGDYWVQAYLHVYTTFNRADGHTIKLQLACPHHALRGLPRPVRGDEHRLEVSAASL